jgi:hypothetical protein
VDRGLALERELWSGEPAPAAEDAPSAAQTAVAIEGLTRAILRDAACGHLGGDLRATADEILLADGLAVGEGEAEQRGGSEEWDLPLVEQAGAEEPQYDPEQDPDVAEAPYDDLDEGPQDDVDEGPQDDVDQGPQEDVDDEPNDDWGGQLWIDISDEWQEGEESRNGRTAMQVPEPESRITIESRPKPEEESVFAQSHNGRQDRLSTVIDAGERSPSRVAELLEERPSERQEASDRVAYLFPRPETTEWDVRELSYDRRRRAEPDTESDLLASKAARRAS